MSGLPPNATLDEIEEELDFVEIRISTLDEGADDYNETLNELEEQRADLERRLNALHSGQAGQDGDMPPSQGHDQWFSTVTNLHDASDKQNGSASSGMKRPLSGSLHMDSHRPSKRHTPETSNATTPSSTGSFEHIDWPSIERADRAEALRKRQEAAVAQYQQSQRIREADAALARSLQQPSQAPKPSSSRPSYQSTISHNGSYSRPPAYTRPPPPAVPAYGAGPSPSSSRMTQHSASPYTNSGHAQSVTIKSEAGSSTQQQELPQRGKRIVVDLTNSESDDEGLQEISSASFKPRQRAAQNPGNPYGNATGVRPYQQYPTPQQPTPFSMPGQWPGMQTQYVYPDRVVAVASGSGMMQSNPPLPSAWATMRQGARDLADRVAGLSDLINGPSSSYLGNPGREAYAGLDELYQQRVEEIRNYDPAKTTEEINALLDNIRPDEDMPAHLRVQTPKAMTIKLHKYQELGLTWLQKCEDGSNKGGILADDMGLGKTIQMLSLLVTHRSDNPSCKTTLIVAPVALMRQWQQEIEQKIKPTREHSLTVYVHHGQQKKKSFQDLRHYDIVLTTYGSLAAEVKKLESFYLRRKEFPETRPNNSERCALISDDAVWYRVILDEAQCIKNVNTQTAKAACRLNATYRFCMTGTPMMNNVDEFYSLVKFLRIRPYSEWTKFRMDISTPLKKGGSEKAMQMLQALCKAIMLRRTKKSTFEGEPILVLPERTTEVDNPIFSDEEREFYEMVEGKSKAQFNRYLKAGTVGSSYSQILVLLLRLRQACCHPHLLKDFGVAAAAGMTPEQLADLAKELAPHVVERIKATEGSFECPVCYDAVVNPAIFLPCGHDTCRECFAKIADTASREGDNASNAKCPTCRASVDPKRITDFDSFKKVHMPDMLTEAERQELVQLQADIEAAEDDGPDTDSETDDDDGGEVDAKGNLLGFVVNDDVDDSTAEDSKQGDVKEKQKRKGKSKKSKGKKREKREKKQKEKDTNKAVTLADLKRLSTRNAKARKAYLRKLREDWITSAKIEKTVELLDDIMTNTDEKVLIFSQWTSFLDLLEVPIDEQHWGYRRYDGSMNATMRNDAVDDFRDTRSGVRIMLVSLKAGNAGLNLNMANHVIILDPFWNPYIEEQAIDRAHRLGQTKPVKVHRMLIQETVEDRIIALQEKKRALISEALDEKASQNIARLGVQELAYLFGVTRNASQRVQYVPRERR